MATTKKTTRKTAARKPRRSARTKSISAEERYGMIQTAAYLRAEKNGFSGDPVQYWLEAEKEIDDKLASEGIKVKA